MRILFYKYIVGEKNNTFSNGNICMIADSKAIRTKIKLMHCIYLLDVIVV